MAQFLSLCLGSLSSHPNHVHNNFNNVLQMTGGKTEYSASSRRSVSVTFVWARFSIERHKPPPQWCCHNIRSVVASHCFRPPSQGEACKGPVARRNVKVGVTFKHLDTFCFISSLPRYQPATDLAAVTVGSVGIGTTVDGTTRVGRVFSVSAACQQNQDGRDYGQHEYQASNCDTDGKVALRDANAVWILRRLKIVKFSSSRNIHVANKKIKSEFQYQRDH